MAQDVNQTIQDSRRAAMSFLDAAKAKEQNRKNRGASFPKGGGSRSGRAVDNFLRAGRVQETRKADPNAEAHRTYDLADKVRYMSDEEFDNALKSGAITPEQLRKAGEYEWDVYMGDVWSETDLPDQMPEPSYDEFMANPEKYGYTPGVNDELDRAFSRYKSTVKQQ